MTVIERASMLTGVSAADLKGPCRDRKLCVIRWAIMLALHRRGLQANAIARLLNRHHSTVLSGLRNAAINPEAVALAEKLG